MAGQSKRELTESDKANNERVMLFATVGTMASLCVLMQATPSLVLMHYKGDSSAAVKSLNQMAAAAAFTQFLLNGAFGGLSDQLGRKPFLLLAPLATLVLRALTALSSDSLRYRVVVVSRVVAGALVPAFMTAIRASFVDMHASSPHTLSALGGKFQAVIGAALVLGSLLGGRLAARDVRLPYVASSVLGGVVLAVLVLGYKESLSHDKRKPFNPSTINPLSFLSLFSVGDVVSRLCAAQALMAFPENMGDVGTMFAREVVGWDNAAQGAFTALLGISNVVAGAFTGEAIAALGSKRFTLIATAMSVLGTLAHMKGSPGAVYGGMLVGMPGLMRKEAIGALVPQLVPSGYGQGRLAADRANLLAVVQFVAPLFYMRMWQLGAKRKDPTLPYKATVIVLVVAQAIASSVRSASWAPRKRE